MKKIIKNYLSLLSKAYSRFQEVNVHDLGAALAYFSIFAIVPLLSVLIILASIFLGRELIQGEILNSLQGTIGTDAVTLIQNAFESTRNNDFNLLANIIGGLVLVFAVIGITAQLQSSLDRILGYKIKEISFLKMIRERISTFFIILLMAFLLIVFLTLSTGISFLKNIIEAFLPVPFLLVQSINFLLTLLFVFVFSVINFKYLPHVKLSWQSVFHGAFVTSILFILGKFALSIYLFFANPGSAYGAAGAILILLLWIYYSSQVLFFGACISHIMEKNLK